MSATDSTECDRLKLAAEKIIALPGLTVKDAMKLADFSLEEREDKNMRQKVLRRLPGKGKRRMKEGIDDGTVANSVVVEKEQNSDVSPLTSDSARTVLTSEDSQKPKFRRLTVSQKQDQRANECVEWNKYKDAHKAATRLYAEQLPLDDGMSLRDVEKKIKSEFKVGPSRETIRRHVMDLNSIGVSPTKRGPDGNIPPHHYKSLCMAFASKTRICQLNAKVSTRRKQIKWIKSTLKCTNEEASTLWKRISRDTAVDMVAGKIKHAEERRVKWTTYYNLELWFDNEQWAIMNAKREQHATNQGLGGDP